MRYIRKLKGQDQIHSFFQNSKKRVFTFQDLTKIIDQYRNTWKLPVSLPIHKLVNRLEENDILRTVKIDFGSENNTVRYFFDDPSIYELAVSVSAKSYVSHFPAAFLHGLTNQIPKVIYVTREQSAKPTPKGILTQEAIDIAFSKPQRHSEIKGIYQDYTIVLLNGKATNRFGVITTSTDSGNFAYTGLERTLIDITVRPSYGGGAYAVLDAYERALNQDLSINKLAATLQNLDFIYPYHQATGFYLQKAGYKGRLLDLFKQKPIVFDFYLDYELGDKEFSPEWRIYYPKGM